MTATNPAKNQACFRTYDVRAVVGETFNADTYRLLGRTYAAWLEQQHGIKNTWVAVGCDARLHSMELKQGLNEGLMTAGLNVLDLNLCPTPAVYFAEYAAGKLDKNAPELTGTLIVTGSHNAAKYNGLKMSFHGHALSPENIQELKAIFTSLNELPTSPPQGQYQPYNILPVYIDYLCKQTPVVKTPLKIVMDAGHATGGLVAPEVFRRLGCDVVDLFSKPDGHFPAHHPDPCKHENLQDLIQAVREHKADFGIAFDGDSDRLGVVDCDGKILPGDILLLLFSEALLKKVHDTPPVIVSEVKCTQLLFDYINSHGGKAIMAPTGNAFIKRIMKTENGMMGGELSGHFFFRDRYFGFDDAFYAAIRLLEIVAARKQESPAFQTRELTAAFPASFLSEEQRVDCPRDRAPGVIKTLSETLPEGLRRLGIDILDINPLDGIRLSFQGGFLLVRPSNTEPCLTIRYEVPDENLAKGIDAILAKEFSHSVCH